MAFSQTFLTLLDGDVEGTISAAFFSCQVIRGQNILGLLICSSFFANSIIHHKLFIFLSF